MTAPRSASGDNHYLWGDHCDGWRLIDSPDLSLREERIPPGCAEAPHFHRASRQIFYVLAGELTIHLSGQTVVAAAGEAVEIAPGQPHLVRNCGDQDLRLLLVSSPDTAGDRHFAEPPGLP